MKPVGKIIGFAAVLAATFGAWAALTPSYAQYVDGWGHAVWGHWAFGGLWFVLVWAVLIVAAIALVRAFTRRRIEPVAVPSPPTKPTPLDILDERFARGEIDKADYEERRRVLSNRGVDPPNTDGKT